MGTVVWGGLGLQLRDDLFEERHETRHRLLHPGQLLQDQGIPISRHNKRGACVGWAISVLHALVLLVLLARVLERVQACLELRELLREPLA